jgi:hypothetical protein
MIAHSVGVTYATQYSNQLYLRNVPIIPVEDAACHEFRDLITASSKYGFSSGNYNAETIALTELGEQLTKPRNQQERLDALRQGMRNIPLFEQLVTHFDNSKLPPTEFLRNTLEREPFSVPPEWSAEAADVFTRNGREVGFVRTITNSPYVILEAGAPTEDV